MDPIIYNSFSFTFYFMVHGRKTNRNQAGAELGRAQLKLGLDLDLFGILGLVAS